MIEQLFKSKLIICVGSGGVGKTTTSASIALRAASQGLKVLVLTIDPARRLADAMGLAQLDNSPRKVVLDNKNGGSLDAMMLDAKETFDDLIRRTAGKDSQSIFDNRLYQIMTEQLAGTLEYMALERLYDLYESKKWQLIVLDTPPAQNTKDFFSAPERVASLFDERIMRWFVPSINAKAGFFRRKLNPGAIVLKLIGILGGKSFVMELTEFFTAMNLVRSSLHKRGKRVQEILREKDTHYIVISSPDPRRVDEALSLQNRLLSLDKEVVFFILNRSHHRYYLSDLDALEKNAEKNSNEDVTAYSRIRTFYERLTQLAERDRSGIQQLYERADLKRVRLIPILGHDIHTLAELLQLSDHIFTTA